MSLPPGGTRPTAGRPPTRSRTGSSRLSQDRKLGLHGEQRESSCHSRAPAWHGVPSATRRTVIRAGFGMYNDLQDALGYRTDQNAPFNPTYSLPSLPGFSTAGLAGGRGSGHCQAGSRRCSAGFENAHTGFLVVSNPTGTDRPIPPSRPDMSAPTDITKSSASTRTNHSR